jgi:hypothetical protein
MLPSTPVCVGGCRQGGRHSVHADLNLDTVVDVFVGIVHRHIAQHLHLAILDLVLGRQAWQLGVGDGVLGCELVVTHHRKVGLVGQQLDVIRAAADVQVRVDQTFQIF